MAEAAVHGLQGNNLDSDHSIVATLKHFAAYSVPEGGHNGGMAHVGPRELREIYLKPFEAGVRAGALSLMAAYNEIDGIPCGANRALLTDILRDEWGFQGFLISDLACLRLLWEQLHVAPDLVHAGAMGLRAGVDIEMFGGAFSHESLTAALQAGLITIADIDRAVSRILRVKFLLGLFEHPFADLSHAAEVVACAYHKMQAQEVARQGIVLLNNAAGLLPLSKGLRSIAVVGPNADAIYNQLGDYTAPQPRQQVTTVLDGVREQVSTGTTVRYARGCAVRDPSKAGFPAAIDLARQSEVVIAVVGGSSARNFGQDTDEGGIPTPMAGNGGCWSQDMDCGEGVDRSDLEFSGVQLDLLKTIYETRTPMVVVLIKGRPLLLNWLSERNIPILDTGYPGCEGGRAIADVLFGNYNPAGRLTMSVPRSTGQLPIYYSSKIGPRSSYIDETPEPLYAFGYGLSYTHFTYTNLRVTPNSIRAGETIALCVDITNDGRRAGDEVVQLYLRDEVSSVTRPYKELKGFRRICLQAGETQTVTFTLGREELQLLNAHLNPVVEPGIFSLMVGGNSADLQAIQLEVTQA
jgi:beta-glucosidase